LLNCAFPGVGIDPLRRQNDKPRHDAAAQPVNA